ncbi:MAG: AAA family ATPase [Armatimonadota bacterium]|nr:AAA family ATPase [Armatimonadota bacterium]
MFHGLLRWWETDDAIRREMVLRRAARAQARRLLARSRLPDLDLTRFLESVCHRGRVLRADGTPVSVEALASLSPHRLERMLASGELCVTGNQAVDCTGSGSAEPTPEPERTPVRELRRFLMRLLGSPGESLEAVRQATTAAAPIDVTTCSLVLCLSDPETWAIFDPRRVAGLRRLSLMLAGGCSWGAAATDYEHFLAAARELRDASCGVLEDLLAVDLLLCRLAELGEARAWKVAAGLSGPQAEAAAVSRRSLAGGFAAIAPDDPDDPNITRLQQIQPGDCLVMHLPGRIGAVGRVTRPYYEVDPDCPDPLDRRCRRRIGVQWMAGDRDYGSILAGAQQRFSVVELSPDAFWSIARMYRQDPQYDLLFRPLRGAWVLACDKAKWARLSGLSKPLPLRDQWQIRLHGEEPQTGDLALLFRRGGRPGFAGLARVISGLGPKPRDDSALSRVDVLYQRLFERPLSPDGPGLEAGLASWQPPSPDETARLSAEQTAMLCERMGAFPERHFVLLTGGTSVPMTHPQTTFTFNHESDGCSKTLSDAVEAGQARCLVYHGSPENRFAGFGRAVAVAEREARVDLCRFPRRTGLSASGLGTSLLREEGSRSSRRARSVLPISAYDFYRVVAVGMGRAGSAASVPRSIEELAQDCGGPTERFREMERLLRRRGQLILYGPPGTGKTWLALRLADYLTGGDESRQRLVQFHPSYSYEDFVEGIRPRAVEGAGGHAAVEYPVLPGAFVTFCDRARNEPDDTWVLVIDEISRAHLSRVFGELMLALEYRGREVELAHTRQEGGRTRFSVPPNVLVLGTMNTADRSAAGLDFALRRRFVFYPLFPDDPELVLSMFRSWLDENAPDARWVAALLAALNERLEPEVGRDLLVGHSYFMRPGLCEQRVREIWRFELHPLLEEYFAGAPERLDAFDIDELIREARSRADSSAVSDEGAAAPGRSRPRRHDSLAGDDDTTPASGEGDHGL